MGEQEATIEKNALFATVRVRGQRGDWADMQEMVDWCEQNHHEFDIDHHPMLGVGAHYGVSAKRWNGVRKDWERCLFVGDHLPTVFGWAYLWVKYGELP